MTPLTHSLTHSLSIFLSFSFSLSLSLFLSFSFSLSLFLSFSPTFCLINRVLFDSQVNGEPQDDKFKRLSGYIEQQNIHTPRATVREVKQPPLFLARICFMLVWFIFSGHDVFRHSASPERDHKRVRCVSLVFQISLFYHLVLCKVFCAFQSVYLTVIESVRRLC